MDKTTSMWRYFGVSSLALLAMGCASLDEITVRRINIVDDAGIVRLVIAGEVPDPVIRGERLERSIVAAGILWNDKNGNESGGMATAPVSGWNGAPRGKVRMVSFDFTHQITDAVRLGTYESDDGTAWEGGLTIFDRRPYDPGLVTTSQGEQRIFLGSRNEDAGLVIMDPQERERIRIGVDSNGVAIFEILDENGEVVFRAPPAAEE